MNRDGGTWEPRPRGHHRPSFWEHTLASEVNCSGTGLHTGRPVDLLLRPAPAGTGVVLLRRDLPGGARFPARAEWVVDTELATTLGTPRARLSTVEHLISALRGMGVDNCTVEVFGPEVPIMDGSAAPFVYLIEQAGLVAQRRVRRRLVIRKPVEVREGDRYIRAIPSREFKVSVEVEYRHPAIGRQTLRSLRVTPRTYAREIAPARTFGFLSEVTQLQARGLARGGSLQNAIVLDERRVLNPEGLRFRNEFARHKVLDLIGDLALLGSPLQGHFKAVRSGHALHQALIAELRANPSCWALELADASKDSGTPEESALSLPSFTPAS
jgi:UDP-3-O-[3-hydroxymyristoyl] N-acetylglucosamine deacetylase